MNGVCKSVSEVSQPTILLHGLTGYIQAEEIETTKFTATNVTALNTLKGRDIVSINWDYINQITERFIDIYENVNKVQKFKADVEIREYVQFIDQQVKNNDIILDPFGGSNITGYNSEKLCRNWVSIELNHEYIEGSKGRFEKNAIK